MSKLFTAKIILASSILLVVATGCSPRYDFAKAKPDVIQKYKSRSQNKALAYAKDFNGGFVYGIGYNFKTIAEAKKKALSDCKARRKVEKLKDTCSFYMVNNKRVEQ